MVNVTVEQGRLEVRMTGWDRIWALKGRLSAPIEHVKRIELDPDGAQCRNWKGLRLPGSSLPGVIVAGSYWWKDGWTFWCVRRLKGSKVVLIFLRDERFHRMALHVPDPDAVYDLVQDAIASGA